MSQTHAQRIPQLKSRIGAILRATSGNFLEQFDFFLFGFYASYIAKAFFPSENETAALLNTFGVFWLGALMRPVGAIVLGAYIDRIGRRKGLIVTLAIMAVGTVIASFFGHKHISFARKRTVGADQPEGIPFFTEE